jgi:hypothetical protein
MYNKSTVLETLLQDGWSCAWLRPGLWSPLSLSTSTFNFSDGNVELDDVINPEKMHIVSTVESSSVQQKMTTASHMTSPPATYGEWCILQHYCVIIILLLYIIINSIMYFVMMSRDVKRLQEVINSVLLACSSSGLKS